MFDFSSLGFSVSMPMGYRAPSTAASKKLTIFVFFTYILEWTINLLHKDNRKRNHPRLVLMAEGHVKCKIRMIKITALVYKLPMINGHTLDHLAWCIFVQFYPICREYQNFTLGDFLLKE